jgi:murein L,D-transpeptidase YafK
MKPEAFVRTNLWVCCVLLWAGCSTHTAATRIANVSTSVKSANVKTANTKGAPVNSANVKARPVLAPFVQEQLQFSRVREARDEAGDRIERMFRERNINYPASQIFIRVFKQERELELWVLPESGTRFELLQTYPICKLAGRLGPKKKQGDRQVPEGFYSVDFFNPVSNYHLSLRVDYPNQRDRVTATARNLGGDIFIHGGCVSVGCIAITDEGIQELYWMAVMARGRNQRSIPVHIFPTRLDKSTNLNKLKRLYHDDSVVAFWQTLRPGYEYFEEHRRIPQIAVDRSGRYRLTEAIAAMD